MHLASLCLTRISTIIPALHSILILLSTRLSLTKLMHQADRRPLLVLHLSQCQSSRLYCKHLLHRLGITLLLRLALICLRSRLVIMHLHLNLQQYLHLPHPASSRRNLLPHSINQSEDLHRRRTVSSLISIVKCHKHNQHCQLKLMLLMHLRDRISLHLYRLVRSCSLISIKLKITTRLNLRRSRRSSRPRVVALRSS